MLTPLRHLWTPFIHLSTYSAYPFHGLETWHCTQREQLLEVWWCHVFKKRGMEGITLTVTVNASSTLYIFLTVNILKELTAPHLSLKSQSQNLAPIKNLSPVFALQDAHVSVFWSDAPRQKCLSVCFENKTVFWSAYFWLGSSFEAIWLVKDHPDRLHVGSWAVYVCRLSGCELCHLEAKC